MKLANHRRPARASSSPAAPSTSHDASDGRFGPTAALPRLDAFRRSGIDLPQPGIADCEPAALDEAARRGGPRRAVARAAPGVRRSASTTPATPPSPAWSCPSVPAVFTKYPASLGGPFDPIALSRRRWSTGRSSSSWSSGRRADRVSRPTAWDHVAGLCVGQDVSDRHVQFAAGAQFSLGKSYRTYGPTGPWLVTPDELDDPDDLALGCSIDGETVQDDRTSGPRVPGRPADRRDLGGACRCCPAT